MLSLLFFYSFFLCFSFVKKLDMFKDLFFELRKKKLARLSRQTVWPRNVFHYFLLNSRKSLSNKLELLSCFESFF